jgi:hypothetical protein
LQRQKKASTDCALHAQTRRAPIAAGALPLLLKLTFTVGMRLEFDLLGTCCVQQGQKGR